MIPLGSYWTPWRFWWQSIQLINNFLTVLSHKNFKDRFAGQITSLNFEMMPIFQDIFGNMLIIEISLSVPKAILYRLILGSRYIR